MPTRLPRSIPRLDHDPDGLRAAIARMRASRSSATGAAADDPRGPVAASPAVRLSRRQLLRAGGALAALASVPLTRVRRALATARGRFLTGPELATLEALCDRILPPDADPGAAALGAARYVDALLSAFDRVRIPFLYAGGPFSGRNPHPDTRAGVPGRRRPRNDFATPVPPSRMQELRWRAELYGSEAVPETAMNDTSLGPLRGLRDIYREGLARVDEVAREAFDAPFVALTTAQQDELLPLLDRAFAPDPRRRQTFMDILVQHTIEGCFAAPEYGGNADARGWELIGIEGDTHPLGFSIYSRDAGRYNERADHPMSTPNPDELAADGTLAPKPIGPDAQKIQTSIMTLSSSLGDGC